MQFLSSPPPSRSFFVCFPKGLQILSFFFSEEIFLRVKISHTLDSLKNFLVKKRISLKKNILKWMEWDIKDESEEKKREEDAI